MSVDERDSPILQILIALAEKAQREVECKKSAATHLGDRGGKMRILINE